MKDENERERVNKLSALDNNPADVCHLIQVTANRWFCEEALIIATEPNMTAACKPLVQHVTRGAQRNQTYK